MKTLVAFHGDPAIKEKYLARVMAHRAADEIVQGYGYWKNGKGCAVGCTIHGSDHRAYETELGIPEALARVEDTIFEWLPAGEVALNWPVDFLTAIQVGADLSSIVAEFFLWAWLDPKEGLLEGLKPNDAQRVSITRYINAVADAMKSPDAALAARAALAALAADYDVGIERGAAKLIELLKAAPMAEVAVA